MTDNRTTELMPCPFCGGETSKRLFYKGKYRVHCNVCDAHSGDVCATEAKAITAWNTRHVETCKVESSFLNDFSSDHECWFEFDLSCGHHIKGDVMEPPNYCEVCGAKIQGVDNAD